MRRAPRPRVRGHGQLGLLLAGTARQVQHYSWRSAGSLLERFDLHVEVPAVPYAELAFGAVAESPAAVWARVNAVLQK